MSDRLEQLHTWLRDELELKNYSLLPASGDASFRRYLRLQYDNQSYIVMDAPPAREDCKPFADITKRLRASGVNAPAILNQDLEQGFLLLTDLGSDLYLNVLSVSNADKLYGDALSALVKIQKNSDCTGLPPYSEALLMNEMGLFRDWLLDRHLGISLGKKEHAGLNKIFLFLEESALSQPKVFVHRDYHSRNLMYCKTHNPGILDFQDAVVGPFTYDLVSLLKDCYIKWPRRQVNNWAIDFYHQICTGETEEARFLRWFDLMGVQRQLKASGIFARLYHRDGKAGYLFDIPRTLSYVLDLDQDYPELELLIELVRSKVTPVLNEVNNTCMP
ncbi:MAG: phosphotransferase [Gammaproteobacteria bacterium]|nr:phosphotransferase [Gammaproteobacteria bacterium]